MSAITGIFFRDGRNADKNLMKEMNASLSHRGPDGSNIWANGPVCFGHQMLWTTPESLYETLPFEDEESGLVITADARIDNRDELSKELGIANKTEIPDSYFILKSYEKWGEECPKKLIGDFAFAIWDKEKEILFCARDHIGVKPFYYYLSDEIFVFAPEIKALNCIEEIQFNVNEIKIANYLVSNLEDQELTFFEDIYRLPAAHQLIIKNERIELVKYWPININKEKTLDSDEEYAQKFFKIFHEAVNCRLRCAFPIGSFLSGGLDSSSIVCTARRILSKNNSNLKTFSLIFDSLPKCDERYFINAVLNEGNLDPFLINGDQIPPLLDIERVTWHEDGPVYAVGYSLFWKIYNIARENKVRVLLDGYEGDDIVSYGTELLVELAISKKWINLIKEIYKISKISNRKHWKIFGEKVVIPLSPKPIRNIWQLLVPAGTFSEIKMQQKLIKCVLNQSLVQNTCIKERCQSRFEESIRILQKPEEYHPKSLDFGTYQYMLEGMDQRSAAFSIEMRYPFFDRRLIEFCLSLPYEQILSDGFDRMILRRSMEGILPKEVQWRKFKTSIGLNFDINLLKFEKEYLNNIFENTHLIKDYVNINALNELYSKYKSGDIDYTVDTPYILWKVANLKLWLNNIENRE